MGVSCRLVYETDLLTAVILYWNTVHLGHAVTERRNEGLDVPPAFLPHISPLGWAHILLTGEYLWTCPLDTSDPAYYLPRLVLSYPYGR